MCTVDKPHCEIWKVASPRKDTVWSTKQRMMLWMTWIFLMYSNESWLTVLTFWSVWWNTQDRTDFRQLCSAFWSTEMMLVEKLTTASEVSVVLDRGETVFEMTLEGKAELAQGGETTDWQSCYLYRLLVWDQTSVFPAVITDCMQTCRVLQKVSVSDCLSVDCWWLISCWGMLAAFPIWKAAARGQGNTTRDNQ